MDGIGVDAGAASLRTRSESVFFIVGDFGFLNMSSQDFASTSDDRDTILSEVRHQSEIGARLASISGPGLRTCYLFELGNEPSTPAFDHVAAGVAGELTHIFDG